MKNRNAKIMLGVVAVGVLLVAAGGFFFTRDRDTASDSQNVVPPAVQAERSDLLPLRVLVRERAFGENEKSLYIISSLTCSHCANFSKNIFPILKKELVDTDKLRVVFADFPLDPPAFAAAMLSRCVPEDKYLGFIDTLYEEQARWAHKGSLERSLIGYARMAGLSEADAKACMDNQALLKALSERRTELSTLYGIDSTPSFLLMKGPRFKLIKDLRSYDQLLKAVNEF